jgi:hypothetical protein
MSRFGDHTGFLKRAGGLATLAILSTVGMLYPVMSMAADVTHIRDIINAASSYQLKQVIVEGTVQNLKAIPAQVKDVHGMCVSYHGYTCTLVDQTGEIEIYNPGVCFDQGGVVEIKDGDHVRVNAKVQLLHAGEYGKDRENVRGIVADIVRLNP